MVLIPLPFPEVTDRDLQHLIRLCSGVYNGITPKDVLRLWSSGLLQGYRFQEDGLVLLQVWEHESGLKELLIWGIVGKGFFASAEEIYRQLEHIALKEGCRWIGAYAERPAFQRLYHRLLGKGPRAQHYVSEVRR